MKGYKNFYKDNIMKNIHYSKNIQQITFYELVQSIGLLDFLICFKREKYTKKLVRL